jgi:hypothetical protein
MKASSSPGSVVMVDKMPCVIAFMLDLFLPSIEVGPVDFLAFSWLAFICASVVILYSLKVTFLEPLMWGFKGHFSRDFGHKTRDKMWARNSLNLHLKSMTYKFNKKLKY